MARWLDATPQGVWRLGLLYGANTAGAVLGCVAAGFYLLRVYDMPTATYVAAGINGFTALASFVLAARTLAVVRTSDKAPRRFMGRDPWPIYVAIGLSGFTALGAEVVWTRLMSLLLGATVYTFAIILAVFLAGIGLGSAAGSMIARMRSRPEVWLGACQFLLAASMAWTAWMVYTSLPYWPINPSLTRNPWIDFQLDLVRCLWAFLPATLLWGASFPLALAAAAREGEDAGKLAGSVYAANTIGAIAGAIAFSLVLIPRIGTQQSQRVLIVMAAVGALVALRSFGPRVLLALAFAGLLEWSVPPVPWELVAYGRRFRRR